MGPKLFVGNLSFETTDQELKDAFAKAGTCASATVVKDRLTGRSRGFAFVEMTDSEEADRAIASLNGSDFGGRTLNVNEARPRPERSFGGGYRDSNGGGRRPRREPRW